MIMIHGIQKHGVDIKRLFHQRNNHSYVDNDEILFNFIRFITYRNFF